jgi:hypothetical protein
VNVLIPGTLTNSGNIATYFYEELGNSPIAGMQWYIDLAAELSWRIAKTYQAGFKAEMFNLTNEEMQLTTSNTAWCGSPAGTGCQAAIDNWGKATARGQYQQPTRYRFSAIFRF